MKTRALFALVVAAAAARLLLQLAAMPPYAGLDEAWHVARLAFVATEHRQPTMREQSIPSFVGESIRGAPDAMPAFGEMRERWPETVRARGGKIAFHQRAQLLPWESANYEAQQPSLYYAAASALASDDALTSLRRWRLLAAFLALVVIMASASVGQRFFGAPGLVVAALIASLPTWLTLVVRAGNDAPACALAAVGIAVSAAEPRRPFAVAAEAIVWALAVATKLYVWPLAIVVLLFCRMQRASYVRLAVVTGACLIAALLTMQDLSLRTNNPLGHFGFDPVVSSAQPRPIDAAGMVKIEIATFLWTSGQHADAMKPLAMLLFALPLAVIARARNSPYFRAAAAAGALFAVAALIEASSFIRQARAAGLSLPLGGKEGWYWYALAPLGIGLFVAHARLAAAWLAIWDVIIHEGALFHDWAGLASPAHPSLLFRWGPFQAPFTAHLEGIGVGPLASHLVLLRALHLIALAAAFGVATFQRERPGKRDLSAQLALKRNRIHGPPAG